MPKMPAALLLPALLLAAQPAGAAVTATKSYLSTGLGCEEIRALLDREGAAVLRWTGRSGAPLYLRAVRVTAECDRPDVAVEAYVPASDTPQCPVRKCERPNYIP